MNYEQRTMNDANKNKPNTNPIKPNFRKAKMNLNSYLTKDYENKSNWTFGENKPKQSQFPIILVSLNWLCIISFSVMVT